MTDKEIFVQFITSIIGDSIAFKLILSKPRAGVLLRSATIEKMANTEFQMYRVLEKSVTQHFTKVIDAEEVSAYIKNSIEEKFFFGEIISERGNGSLLQNNKGTSTFIKKKGRQLVNAVEHNRSKTYLIPEEAAYLIDLGISSKNGKVYEHATKKYRQINKFIEIVDGLIDSKTKKIKIADMGSGKAYLTFSLYYYLTNHRNIDTTLTGYELRNDLVNECNAIAKKNVFDQLVFEQGNIEDLSIEAIDMIVSLHACDIATDMAIHAGLKAKARILVLAPCCHKQVRKQIELKNGILKHGILLERQAEIVTDAIRALIMEDHGYKAKVFEFISSEHTQKNTMIIASKFKRNEHAALEIKDIKELYGIRYHYLEKLVEKDY